MRLGRKTFKVIFCTLLLLSIINFTFAFFLGNNWIITGEVFYSMMGVVFTGFGVLFTFSEYLNRKENARNKMIIYVFSESNIDENRILRNRHISMDIEYSKLLSDLIYLIKFNGNHLENEKDDFLIIKKELTKCDDKDKESTFSRHLTYLQEKNGATLFKTKVEKDSKDVEIELLINPLKIKKTSEFSNYRFYKKKKVYDLKIYKKNLSSRLSITNKRFIFFKIMILSGNGEFKSAKMKLSLIDSKGNEKVFNFILGNIDKETDSILIDVEKGAYNVDYEYEIMQVNLEVTNQFGDKIHYKLGGVLSKGYRSYCYELERYGE